MLKYSVARLLLAIALFACFVNACTLVSRGFAANPWKKFTEHRLEQAIVHKVPVLIFFRHPNRPFRNKELSPNVLRSINAAHRELGLVLLDADRAHNLSNSDEIERLAAELGSSQADFLAVFDPKQSSPLIVEDIEDEQAIFELLSSLR